jgi:hypothetical protein
MIDPNNAPDILRDDSGDLIKLGLQIDDGVYIVNEWVSQAVPVAGLLARANTAKGTLSEFLLSDYPAVIPPLRLLAPLLTGPNAGTIATRALTRVPGTYATDNLTPIEAQSLLLEALNRPTPHTNTWRMTSSFVNNLAVLPNDNLSAANTRELWELSVGGQKLAVLYSWGGIDTNGKRWFRDYCFSRKNSAGFALITLPLRLLPDTNVAITAVSSFDSLQIPNLTSARIDAAARLQVAPTQLGYGRLASTSIDPLPNGIDANTPW